MRRFRLSRLATLLTAALVAVTSSGRASTNAVDSPTVIVVVGASGEEAYGKNFESWAANWAAAGEKAGAKNISIGLGATNETTDLERLKQGLREEPKESTAELWVVLIGHGTFDSRDAKFNLRGPDLSAAELGDALKPFHRPLAVIDCASSSGPFLKVLAGTNRVVVTATRSGHEQNYSRFGQYLSEAIADARSDLDRDGQTSLLEAFLTASRRVAEFYESEGRLATEHALIDDNGDGLGTPADWFRGIHAVKKAQNGASADGLRAHQFNLVRGEQEEKMPPAIRARRDELELSIGRLRDRKGQLAENEYYAQLEKLLIELAKLYQQTGAARP